RASRTMPTRDWLMTTVGPPDWPMSTLPEGGRAGREEAPLLIRRGACLSRRSIDGSSRGGARRVVVRRGGAPACPPGARRATGGRPLVDTRARERVGWPALRSADGRRRHPNGRIASGCSANEQAPLDRR